MADAIFEDPGSRRWHDSLEPDRRDLDVYADVSRSSAPDPCSMSGAAPARSPACWRRGVEVTAVDPAAASSTWPLSQGRAVRWLHGDATTLPPLRSTQLS